MWKNLLIHAYSRVLGKPHKQLVIQIMNWNILDNMKRVRFWMHTVETSWYKNQGEVHDGVIASSHHPIPTFFVLIFVTIPTFVPASL